MEDMKSEVSKSKKLHDIQDDDFTKVQDYFNDRSLYNSRMAFKVRSQMLAEIPGNFKNKYRNNEEGLRCSYCPEGAVLTQGHCLQCPAWEEQRTGVELSNIDGMVTFFRNMLAEMERMDARSVSTETALNKSCS